MQKVLERILNLLAFLLTVSTPATAEEIRYTVKGYDQSSDEAFRRTFERDKDLLRSLGVPIELRHTDAWEVEVGYLIAPNQYAIPDPGLTDEERTALLLAAQAVRFGGQSTEAAAIFKLGGASPQSAGSLTADLGHDLGMLGDLFGALTDRRTVSFTYTSSPRVAEPYGLGLRFGNWYLLAPETDQRSTVKAFRVDRMSNVSVGEVAKAFARPTSFDTGETLSSFSLGNESEATTARIRFDIDIADVAIAQSTSPKERSRDERSVVVDISVFSPDRFVAWMLGFDDKAVIESPKELVDLLLARLGNSP